MLRLTTALLCLLLFHATARSHDIHPRNEPTYTIAAPADPDPDQPSLTLEIRDAATGAFHPARFSILIDGNAWFPDALDKNGIHFTSIHTGKKQRATLLYARGTGPVSLSLPPSTTGGEIIVTKGYEYLSETIPFTTESTTITSNLVRWSNLHAQGWLSADEHLHYERSDPAHDADWFTMLAADGLDEGFFMILDGGNLPGPWAEQHTYGESGRFTSEGLSLIPGEEFRCSLQGHNNLHGIAEVLHPITVGRGQTPPESYHWPTTHDILTKVTTTGGIGGPAHGGTFGKASTAIRDAVLGASEFFELANTHLYELDPWYRLLNCGYLLPPVAGTDLPNFPWRTPVQPFFGETRTYVRVDATATATFEDWKESLRAGRSFITSGPLITLTIDGHELGDPVHLSGPRKKITLAATLAGPRPLTSFEIIHNGKPLSLDIIKTRDDKGVHRWSIDAEIEITRSSWFAARGSGVRKDLLWAETGILQRSIAHTAAIPVYLGDQPIFDQSTAITLINDLKTQREIYATQATFPNDEARTHTLTLFDQAIAALKR